MNCLLVYGRIKRLLVFLLAVLFTHLFNAHAYTYKTLWPGQSVTVEVGAITGYYSPTWTTTNPTLKLEGTGFYRKITATSYFGGIATVTCTYKYSVGTSTYNQSQSWDFECYDNSISVTPTSMQLAPGESQNLSWSFKYSTYMTPSVQFTGYDSSIIDVYPSGTIVAKKEGRTTVYIASNISTNSVTCIVTVKTIQCSDISLPSTMDLYVDEQREITPSITPSNAQTTLSWSSSNTSIATVSSLGVVKGLSPGVVDIYVTTDNGLSAKCQVEVKKTPPQPSLVELPTSVLVNKGWNYQLVPKVSPSDAVTQFTWTSHNPEVATISDYGLICTHAIGVARIVVATENNLSAECNVTVIDSGSGTSYDELSGKLNRIKRLIYKTNRDINTLNHK